MMSIIKVSIFYSLFLLCVFVFMPSGLVLSAEKPKLPESRAEVIQADDLLNGGITPMDPEVEVTVNDGYWWIKQDSGVKLRYVKDLLKAFKLKGERVGLTSKELVSKLNTVYNPKGEPKDTKMGLRLEEVASLIIKESVK